MTDARVGDLVRAVENARTLRRGIANLMGVVHNVWRSSQGEYVIVRMLGKLVTIDAADLIEVKS